MGRHIARMMDGDAFSRKVVAADLGLAIIALTATVAAHLV
jgi:hypothetical protein